MSEVTKHEAGPASPSHGEEVAERSAGPAPVPASPSWFKATRFRFPLRGRCYRFGWRLLREHGLGDATRLGGDRPSEDLLARLLAICGQPDAIPLAVRFDVDLGALLLDVEHASFDEVERGCMLPVRERAWKSDSPGAWDWRESA